jgi:hypothetical protein
VSPFNALRRELTLTQIMRMREEGRSQMMKRRREKVLPSMRRRRTRGRTRERGMIWMRRLLMNPTVTTTQVILGRTLICICTCIIIFNFSLVSRSPSLF